MNEEELAVKIYRAIEEKTIYKDDIEKIVNILRETFPFPAPADRAREPSGENLIEALAAIEKAQDEVSALCNGKRWIMSVPAREDEDSDLVIAAALHKAKQILARLSPPSSGAPQKDYRRWSIGERVQFLESVCGADKNETDYHEAARALNDAGATLAEAVENIQFRKPAESPSGAGEERL
jgi:hypothetical protein